VRPHWSLKAASKQFSVKEREIFKDQVRTLPVFFENSHVSQTMQSQHDNHIMNHFTQCFVTQTSGPANYQASRFMPINYQGLCPSIYPRAASLRLLNWPGGEHLTYDRFKTYVDQGVHFQIIISKSILLIHSLSPVYKAKCFEIRPAQLIYHKTYFTAEECTC